MDWTSADRTFSGHTLAALVFALVVAACSSATSSPIQSRAPKSSASLAPDHASTPDASTTATTTKSLGAPLSGDLIGTWTSNISDANVAVIQQHAPDFTATGTWTMVLSATTFQFLNPNDETPGPYPVGLSRANEITVAPELD